MSSRLSLLILALATTVPALAVVPVWQTHELIFHAATAFDNPYRDVDLWVRWRGPDGTDRQVHGFWDGDNVWKVRLTATTPGEWVWVSQSNQPDTAGFNGHRGSIRARAWSTDEIASNPNRRGFLRATPNGHALAYADGTPFFFTADTWWSASTGVWRWDDAGGAANISFQDAVQVRKQQGFNGVAIIASFPNWTKDGGGAGNWAANAMEDEDGNLAFARLPDTRRADYDRLVPSYFRNLDRKLQHLSDEGFVVFLETVRRDHLDWTEQPGWEESFARYTRYLIARYGTLNMIFSWLHWDYDPAALERLRPGVDYAYRAHGGLPFGQPQTALCWGATDDTWGHGAAAPFLTMHGVGNKPRDARDYPALRRQFHLFPAYPTLNQEPYYPGFLNSGTEADHYLARAQMYLSPINGGLAGHIWGSGHFSGHDGRTGLTLGLSPTMGHLKTFFLANGRRYQDLIPAPEKLVDLQDERVGLAATAAQDLLLGYIARGAAISDLRGLPSGTRYHVQWWQPDDGAWIDAGHARVDADGRLALPAFPEGGRIATVSDWPFRLSRID